MNIRERLKISYFLLLSLIFPAISLAIDVPLSLFPIENYNQNINTWLPPTGAHYNTPLLSSTYQKNCFQEFLKHYFSTEKNGLSPWSEDYVTYMININNGIISTEQNLFIQFNNDNKSSEALGYGENLRLHTTQWIHKIQENANLAQFSQLKFNPINRSIIVDNTYLRKLPTQDPHFYRFDLPGQGYPFDNLQEAALWVGTPAYILGQTKDHAWTLIIVSNLIGWVNTTAIAQTSDSFVRLWKDTAQRQLISITQTETPIKAVHHESFLLMAYIGSIFPMEGETAQHWNILFPGRNDAGKATIQHAIINKQYARVMPLSATPKNFAMLFQSLQGRPYGWGGLNFYNDCSSELKNLFTPFGIWLPYNSSEQRNIGKSIDISAKSKQDRLNYLMTHGHPLMTLVYVNGHIFLYLGNYPNAQDSNHTPMAMTYQDVWALNALDHHKKRSVIGESVFFPLLASYPEDATVISQADRKTFQLIYLD